jgi:hypothetical protein
MENSMDNDPTNTPAIKRNIEIPPDFSIIRWKVSYSASGWHSHWTLAPIVLRHHFSMALPFLTNYVFIQSLYQFFLFINRLIVTISMLKNLNEFVCCTKK